MRSTGKDPNQRRRKKEWRIKKKKKPKQIVPVTERPYKKFKIIKKKKKRKKKEKWKERRRDKGETNPCVDVQNVYWLAHFREPFSLSALPILGRNNFGVLRMKISGSHQFFSPLSPLTKHSLKIFYLPHFPSSLKSPQLQKHP